LKNGNAIWPDQFKPDAQPCGHDPGKARHMMKPRPSAPGHEHALVGVAGGPLIVSSNETLSIPKRTVTNKQQSRTLTLSSRAQKQCRRTSADRISDRPWWCARFGHDMGRSPSSRIALAEIAGVCASALINGLEVFGRTLKQDQCGEKRASGPKSDGSERG